MTKNQIEYNKLLETRRANIASEQLTQERDRATRQLGFSQLDETVRHNRQVELQARDNLAETYRNNIANLQELQRSHFISEGISQVANALKREAQEETARHNKVQEEISLYSADMSRAVADISAASHTAAAGMAAAASQYASDNALLAKQLQLDLDKYGIDVDAIMRSSTINETKRSNIARETETNRTNLANEGIRSTQAASQVASTATTNLLNAIKANADVNIRLDQNRIASASQKTQQQLADQQLELLPSQKFVNVTRGINNLTSPVASAVSLVSKFLK